MPKLKVAVNKSSKGGRPTRPESFVLGVRMPVSWKPFLEEAFQETVEECKKNGDNPPKTITEWARQQFYVAYVKDEVEG